MLVPPFLGGGLPNPPPGTSLLLDDFLDLFLDLEVACKMFFWDGDDVAVFSAAVVGNEERKAQR